MPHPRLVLASTSPYRRELLARLRIPFDTVAPGVDETPLPGERPDATARRLALAKSRAVSARIPGAVVIGSDQVAMLGAVRLDKPGSRENAIGQLLSASGRMVEFHTALAVCGGSSSGELEALDVTRVTFRRIGRQAIERYVDLEQPFDCAGSAKAEGLGIALIERIESTDPTGLIGLPLIALTGLLARLGLPVPDASVA